MNRKLAFIFIIFFALIGCKEKLSEEYDFFGGKDLSNGKYKLLVYGTEGEWIDDFQDFYIDDITTLQNMQKQWTFKYKTDPWACGYGYFLKFVDDKSVLNRKAVNIDCEYLAGWIYFPRNYLEDHKSSFKRMSDQDKKEFKKYNSK